MFVVRASDLRSTFLLGVLGALALALGGCGSDDGHPVAAKDGTAPIPVESTGHGENGQICEPGTSEICFLADATESLSSTCPESYRFCSSDGTHWHACGDYAVTADGRMAPPSEN